LVLGNKLFHGPHRSLRCLRLAMRAAE